MLDEEERTDGRSHVAVVAVLLAVLARLLIGGAYQGATGGGSPGVDFEQYYTAANNLSHGRSAYAGPLYPYTPLVALLMRPIAGLPYDRAARAWAAACVAAVASSVVLFAWADRVSPVRRTAMLVLISVTAFRFWPTVIELWIGNVDMVLLAILAAVYAAESRDRPRVSAVLIACGALVKTWFMGLIVYLILRRAWRSAALAVAAYAAGVAALFSVVGWYQFPQFVERTRAYAWQPNLVTLSLPGVAKMYLSVNPHVAPLVDAPSFAVVVTVLGVSGLAAGLLWSGWRTGKMSRGPLIGLTVMTMLLAMPVCHLYYYVLALPAIWTLLGSRDLRSFGLAVIAYGLLSLPSPTTPVPESFRTFPASLRVATPFFGGLMLWVGLLISSPQAASPATSPPSPGAPAPRPPRR